MIDETLHAVVPVAYPHGAWHARMHDDSCTRTLAPIHASRAAARDDHEYSSLGDLETWRLGVCLLGLFVSALPRFRPNCILESRI